MPIANGFCVVNLGCKVNKVEADAVATALANAGGIPCAQEDARVIVINTCTVTGEAEAKTRKATHRACGNAFASHIVVTGCAVAIDAQSYLEMDPRIIVEPDKSRVAAIAAPFLECCTLGSSSIRRRTRVGIKIQDGCANSCTYCIVHVARGPVWARPVDDTLREIIELEQAGVREVILTGINLGSHQQLVEILSRALEMTSHVRLRLSSIEPLDVSSDLIDLLVQAEGRICRHLHLPLQSGCEKTLREMNRPYSAAQYGDLIGRIRSALPLASFSTDVIAGFPGETDQDFEESRAFCAQMAFSKMHVFRYSQRPGTPAAARIDQIASPLRATRASILRDLAASMRASDAAARIGTCEKIIVEDLRLGVCHGMSESYHPCSITMEQGRANHFEQGSLIEVSITDTCEASLLGTAVG